MKDYEVSYHQKKMPRNLRQTFKSIVEHPIAYKIKAEPGWKGFVLVPYGDSYIYDILDIEYWGYFNSLPIPSVYTSIYHDPLFINSTTAMPIIQNYNGKLKGYFDDLSLNFNWNKVIPQILCVGTFHESEKIDVSKIAEMHYETIKYLSDRADEIKDSLTIPEKDKLN